MRKRNKLYFLFAMLSILSMVIGACGSSGVEPVINQPDSCSKDFPMNEFVHVVDEKSVKLQVVPDYQHKGDAIVVTYKDGEIYWTEAYSPSFFYSTVTGSWDDPLAEGQHALTFGGIEFVSIDPVNMIVDLACQDDFVLPEEAAEELFDYLGSVYIPDQTPCQIDGITVIYDVGATMSMDITDGEGAALSLVYPNGDYDSIVFTGGLKIIDSVYGQEYIHSSEEIPVFTTHAVDFDYNFAWHTLNLGSYNPETGQYYPPICSDPEMDNG